MGNHFFTMETTTTTPAIPTPHVMINNLVIDKKMQEYRDSKELRYFWDLFDDTISTERIERELADNTTKYYGNKVSARNSLIRRELVEAKLFIVARDAYTKITCEKILQFFRTSVFSWSTGGKNYANGGTIDTFKNIPITHLEELYDHDNLAEVEILSELIDEIIGKMIDEFRTFESVRACSEFYAHRPAFGKNSPIFRDCLEYIATIAKHTR